MFMDKLLYKSYCNSVEMHINDVNLLYNLLRTVGSIKRLTQKDGLQDESTKDYRFIMDRMRLIMNITKECNNILIQIFTVNILCNIFINNKFFIQKHAKFKETVSSKMLEFIGKKDVIQAPDLPICDDTVKMCRDVKTLVDMIDGVM
jgi:hypothetical protein